MSRVIHFEMGVDDPERGESIWLYSAEGDSAWAFIDEEYNEWSAYFSPSGDWRAVRACVFAS